MSILTDEEIENLQCAVCDQSFDSKRGLKIHKTKTHDTSQNDDTAPSKEASKEEREFIEGKESKSDTEEKIIEVKKELNDVRTSTQTVRTKVEGLNSRIDSYNERLDRFSDRIGSIKENSRKNEKEIGKIKEQSNEAVELVRQIEPDEIKQKLQERDLEIQEIQTKVDELNTRLVETSEQLSELRSDVDSFQGLEQVRELEENVRDDLEKAKQLEEQIDVQANKVEDMFLKMEEKVSKIQKIKQEEQDLEEKFQEMRKLFDDLEVQVKDLPDKEAFETLKNDVNTKIGQLEVLMPLIESVTEQLRKYENRELATEEDINKIQKQIDKITASTDQGTVVERMKEHSNPGDSNAMKDDSVDDAVIGEFINVYERTAGIENEVEQLREKIEELDTRKSKKESMIFDAKRLTMAVFSKIRSIFPF